mgnify:CR=1 FL=1
MNLGITEGTDCHKITSLNSIQILETKGSDRSSVASGTLFHRLIAPDAGQESIEYWKLYFAFISLGLVSFFLTVLH